MRCDSGFEGGREGGALPSNQRHPRRPELPRLLWPASGVGRSSLEPCEVVDRSLRQTRALAADSHLLLMAVTSTLIRPLHAVNTNCGHNTQADVVVLWCPFRFFVIDHPDRLDQPDRMAWPTTIASGMRALPRIVPLIPQYP